MFIYQENGEAFAKCAGGLEDPLARELAELGAEDIAPTFRGVAFRADPRTLYRAVLESRLSSHVLAPLVSFECRSDQELYDAAKRVDWSTLLGLDDTFAIQARVVQSTITHERYAVQRLKDGIADWFMDREGKRPSVDRENPTIRFDLNIRRDRAVISIDASRGALHMRGYRTESVEAPMRETLAAAILEGARWDGSQPLVDPMCGSGTVLAEGLLRVGGVPAGWRRCRRRPPVSSLPDFDQAVWDDVWTATQAVRRDVPEGLIRGSDIDSGALRATRANLRKVPGGSGVTLSRSDFRDLDGFQDSLIVVNPPYGVRLEDHDTALELYRDLGSWLKHKCTGSTAWVLCGDKELVWALGLRPKIKVPVRNGALDCTLVQLELY